MTYLYIFDIHKNYSITLPECLNNHINIYNNEERKNASIISYSHLVDILNEMGYDASKIVFTDKGKAILDGIYFSISHSKSYSVIAISNHLVGVDVEEWISDTRLNLSKKVLNEEEYQEYLKEINKSEYLTKKWTLKESYGKSIGSGLTSEVFNKTISGYTYMLEDACIGLYPSDDVILRKEATINGES